MPTSGWRPSRGTEAALALAMASVLVAERGGPAGLASAVAASRPPWPRRNRRPAETIERIARGSGRKAEPSGGRRCRFAACRCGRAVCSGQHPELRGGQRRGDGSPVPVWPPPTDAARGAHQAMGAARSRWLSRATPTPPTRSRAPPDSPMPSGRSARSAITSTWTRRRPSATCCCPSIMRSSDGTTFVPARRARSHAASDGAGLQHPPGGRHPAPGRQESRRGAGASTRPPTRRTSRPAGSPSRVSWAKGISTPSGTAPCSAAASSASRHPRASVSLTLNDGSARSKPAFEGEGDFVFVTYPNGMLYDGRGTNKPWLLENGDPVTKITWHSWVEVGLGTAWARRPERRDPGADTAGPSRHRSTSTGIRDDVIAMPLGFGHTEYGTFAKGRGANALDLLGPQGEVRPLPLDQGARPEDAGLQSSPASRACPASSAAGLPRRCRWVRRRRV